MSAQEEGPIVLMNVITVAPADEETLLKAWSHDAAFMKTQPGYISTQLHKGIANYPESAVASPDLFKKVAVANHCVA